MEKPSHFKPELLHAAYSLMGVAAYIEEAEAQLIAHPEYASEIELQLRQYHQNAKLLELNLIDLTPPNTPIL